MFIPVTQILSSRLLFIKLCSLSRLLIFAYENNLYLMIRLVMRKPIISENFRVCRNELIKTLLSSHVVWIFKLRFYCFPSLSLSRRLRLRDSDGFRFIDLDSCEHFSCKYLVRLAENVCHVLRNCFPKLELCSRETQCLLDRIQSTNPIKKITISRGWKWIASP